MSLQIPALGDYLPKQPFFSRTDLCPLEISYNSRTSLGPVWRMDILISHPVAFLAAIPHTTWLLCMQAPAGSLFPFSLAETLVGSNFNSSFLHFSAQIIPHGNMGRKLCRSPFRSLEYELSYKEMIPYKAIYPNDYVRDSLEVKSRFNLIESFQEEQS